MGGGESKTRFEIIDKNIQIFKLQKLFRAIDMNNLKDISYKQKQKIIITVNKA